MSDSSFFAQKSKNNMMAVEVTLTVNAQDFSELSASLIEKRICFKVTSQGLPSISTAGLLLSKQDEVLPDTTSQKAVFERIYHRYMVDEIVHIPPKTKVIAEDLQISTAKFKALFRQYYGLPFYTCYMQRKMEYSCKLLRSGFKASQVSAEVGYSHPIKFNKIFQKYMGVTPKQYQIRYLTVPGQFAPTFMDTNGSVIEKNTC